MATARDRPGLADVDRALGDALDQPCGMPPLDRLIPRRGKVAIVVDDVTRLTPVRRLLVPLLARLADLGVRDEQIELVTALGSHMPMTDADMADRVGPDVAERFVWHNHTPRGSARNVRLGQTRYGTTVVVARPVAQADLRILIGCVEPHVQAGFSGGYKLLFPGCAHHCTIKRLHMLGLERGFPALIGQPPDVNPMRREIEACAALVPRPSLAINVVMNLQGQVAHLLAGDPTRVQAELASACAAMYGLEVPSPGDVVITGSAPMNHDLLQALKSMINTRLASVRNGVMMALMDNRKTFNQLKFAPRLALPADWIRAGLRVLGLPLFCDLMGVCVPHLGPERKFYFHIGLDTLERNHLLAYNPRLKHDPSDRVPCLKVFDQTASLVEAAQRLSPARGRRSRVVVIPYGGICYPIVPA